MHQWKLATITIAYLFVPTFCSQAVSDGKCHYDFEGGCLKIVSYTFKREEVEEKREFTIYYKGQINLKEDVIADCHWAKRGKFDCNPISGFVCDEELRETFSVRLENLCINSGEFLFDVKLSGIFRCKVSTDQYCTNQTVLHNTNLVIKNPKEGSEHQEEGKTNDDIRLIVLPVTCVCLCVLVTVIVISICKLKGKGKCKWQKNDEHNAIQDSACDTTVGAVQTTLTLNYHTTKQSKSDSYDETTNMLEACTVMPDVCAVPDKHEQDHRVCN